MPSKDDQNQGGAAIYRELRDLPNVEFAEHGVGAIEGLYFNVRPGRLFGDVNLRRALEVCIDKPAIVDAATDGQGVRAYGTLGDGMWAANPDLPKVERDVEAGRRLIEVLWLEARFRRHLREGRPSASARTSGPASSSRSDVALPSLSHSRRASAGSI